MKKILTVDDSKAIRTIIKKQLKDLNFDIDESEDGEKGLAQLEEMTYDLVLLDVTMPNLDGVGMLRQMREAGNQTPVIMLTSESKSSVIAEAMKLGIDDYILKPCKPDEMRPKVLKALKMSAGPAGASAAGIPAAEPAEASEGSMGSEARGKQFTDVLIIDDMENVQKKFRGMLPEKISMVGCKSAQEAMKLARDRIFRTVIVDAVIPDVNSVTLMNQLRALQPQANFVSLMLVRTEDPAALSQEQGFDGYLTKPFKDDTVEDFVHRFFGSTDLVTTEDNILTLAAYTGKADHVDAYFRRVVKMIEKDLEKVASACFENAIIDLSNAPVQADTGPKFVLNLAGEAKQLGLEIRVVGDNELGKLLAEFVDTKEICFHESLSEARQAAEA